MNLPSPPPQKMPTTAGAQLFVWFLIVGFVIAIALVLGGVLGG